MQDTYAVTLKIKRYDPETKKTWLQDYHLKARRKLRFTDLVRRINNELAPTLAWN